ncbi:hypothetical protein AcW1_003425 [Taiwanofungus camphoratus]|nr:hypothetical protein AcW1_003425 [Antrodia cinnamomea]
MILDLMQSTTGHVSFLSLTRGKTPALITRVHGPWPPPFPAVSSLTLACSTILSSTSGPKTMSHTSPSTYLTWAVLSCLLGAFLLFHLWKFDRFKCLKWNNGPYSGAFKRIMTYTYLLSVPLLIAYSVGFCIIKYKQGYINVPGEGIIPTPWELWPSAYQRAIFPLNLLFSIAWGLEMVTHLEELCFWLFLVNAGSVQQDWFRSLYFKTWTLGSLFAIIYMPVVTIVTRSDPLKSEAFTFLAGSLGSLSLTIWFTPVLFMFPSFLMGLKREGVDLNTIVRLTTFHELNCLRVLFRFFFVAPLLILGVDGVRTHKHINTSNFWTEFLTFVAAVGCIISSGITLVIFFPRSRQGEAQARYASREKSHQLRTFRSTQHSEHSSYFRPMSPGVAKGSVPLCTPIDFNEGVSVVRQEPPGLKSSPLDPENSPAPETYKTTFSPNRRLDSGTTVVGGMVISGLTEGNLAQHNFQTSNVHPLVHNFTSPIGICTPFALEAGRRC